MQPNVPLPSPFYPESDGQPIAETTKQLRWIFLLFGNLSALFRRRPDVFVAGDLFWYPVEGKPEVRIAPDVLVFFGRPKGDRGSYKQWEEGDVPLTVAFEVLSPSTTVREMDDKHAFYEEHGVEEYYIYDPESNAFQAYARRGTVLRRVVVVTEYVSPRLGIRIDLSGPELVVYGPDGQRFLTFEEAKEAFDRAQPQLNQIQQAEQQAQQAEQRLNQAKQRAQQAQQRAQQAAERLARLAELSRKARRGQASPEELQELDRLEEQSLPPSP